MTIPEDCLQLTLADVLALHDPRRTYNGATVEQLSAALCALEARLARTTKFLEDPNPR